MKRPINAIAAGIIYIGLTEAEIKNDETACNAHYKNANISWAVMLCVITMNL